MAAHIKRAGMAARVLACARTSLGGRGRVSLVLDLSVVYGSEKYIASSLFIAIATMIHLGVLISTDIKKELLFPDLGIVV